MSNQIKKEELEQLQKNTQTFNAIKHDIGTLVLQAFGLCNAYGEALKPHNELTKQLEEEYGKINIDLKDGSYEEIKEDKNE